MQTHFSFSCGITNRLTKLNLQGRGKIVQADNGWILINFLLNKKCIEQSRTELKKLNL
jgi:hypothetical protein